MANPYEELPSRAFWRLAIADRDPRKIGELWTRKLSLSKDEPVATLGSCFAQHIGRALVKAGYSWVDSEPAPKKLPAKLAAEFNYGIFSARVGNVYTVALLKQWVSWAFGLSNPSEEIWQAGERFYDPFRPNIEPGGYASAAEVFVTREQTLHAMRQMFKSCAVFVFTLGLTEAWLNRREGVVYPMCPGTIAGEFDPERHQFHNYTYPEIHADLLFVLETLKLHNPSVKFLLTVSPVPLTATASANHVLVATTHSKSTLRAVAGDIAAARDDTDYFPSFEIISGFPFKAMFYDKNMRTVTESGVEFVMQTFLAEIGERKPDDIVPAEASRITERTAASGPARQAGVSASSDFVDPVCEEMMLDAFAGKSP